MKYCPICQQSYADETLNFCLKDGSHLVTEEFISNSPTLIHSFLSEMISGRHSFGRFLRLRFCLLSCQRGCGKRIFLRRFG